MNEFLTSLGAGQIELNEQKRVRNVISERWDKTGLIDGLNGHLKENIATLFENQAKQLMNEATNSQSSGSFETVVFPIVRRTFSKLLANDIVSVQAMNLPIGKLFYIIPEISQRNENGGHAGIMGAEVENRNNNGEAKKQPYLPREVFTSEANMKFSQMELKNLYDLYYNDGLINRSKGKIHIKTATAASFVEIQGNGSWAVATADSLVVDKWDSVRNVKIKVEGFNDYGQGKLIGPDGNEMDTEAFLSTLKVITAKAITNPSGSTEDYATFKSGEEMRIRLVSQKYGEGIVENSAVYVEVLLTKPTTTPTNDSYIGVKKSVIEDELSNAAGLFTVSWAQYDTLELETEMGEVSFNLKDVVVSAEARKLRATWSQELAQDVAAFHNIDAEAELTALLSEQISSEIDREILVDLRKSAPWATTWNREGWRTMAGHSTNYTQKDWNQELIQEIMRISAQIHKSTLRGGANFVVVSTEISAIFNDLEYFHVTDASAESDQYNMGIEKIGTLSGRLQVYVDPYSPSYSCIVGHKGKSILDTGYIYAPYIPVQLTNTLYNTENFAPVKGIMTRYAKKIVNNRFYGHVSVDGIRGFNMNELR